AKCTYGTGSFIVMNTGQRIVHSGSGLLTTVAWQLGEGTKPVYALEGGAFICGAAVQWLRDGLGIIRNARDIEALANQVADHGGVEFVPALTGLGAPHWVPEARGTFTGLTRGTDRGHIARATLDAMALQNADILRAMELDLGKRMRPLRVDGGAAANNLLMQIQADVLGRKLIRPQVIETTVAGACYLAGLGVGLWSSPAELRKVWQSEREFSSEMGAAQRRRRLASWNTALRRTLLPQD
ncbi:MAG: FGGY-family carbohydrate kinase, partial [Gammaproteobacteria bacterium]|nr:FGGY-family carbohydrate kinase [Gammaproteobacteria bacterium]